MTLSGPPADTEGMTSCDGVPGQFVSTVHVEVPTAPRPSSETALFPVDVGTISSACRGPRAFGLKPTQTVQPVAVSAPVQFCSRIGKSAASGPVTYGWDTVTAVPEVSRMFTG